MSKESYFAQYVSPNIIIVPTVSFSPPRTPTEQKADPISSSTLMPAPSDAICSKQNLNEIVVNTNLRVSTGAIGSTCTSNCSENPPCKEQDSISTEVPPTNMSQSIKELSSSKYKSRNNLVDLTGFNILKRDSKGSLTKHNDSRQIEKEEPKIEKGVIKTIDSKEKMENSDSDSDTSTKYIKSRFGVTSKESKKNEKRMDNRCKNTNSESKQDMTDMEDKMKKYFRVLWKRNLEKLRDKSSKEKRERDLKSIKSKQNCKDSKREPSRSKAKLQKVSKNTATKNNDRKFIAKYPNRSKNETESSFSETTTNHQEGHLSPDYINRYKDFQRFLHHLNGDDNENQNKVETVHVKKELSKSNELATNNSELEKKVARKQSLTSDLHGKINNNPNNTKRVNTMKGIVQLNKNLHRNNSKKTCIERNNLRTKLSLKRTRSDCTHSQQVLENKRERENLVINVKQDVTSDTKISATLAPKVNKTKTKKFKKIKLVINIECPNTDSDDSDQNVNECCASPEDLSFLDDFNVDEIVDSLNVSHTQVENSKINTGIPHLINKTNEKECKTNGETTTKDKLIKDLNIKMTKIKREETSQYKERVLVINSEDEDFNLKKGSVTDTCNNKNEQIMKTNPEIKKKIGQENSNVKELTKEPNEGNMKEEPMDICDDSGASLQESKYIIHEKEHYNTSKDLLPPEILKLSCLSNSFDRPTSKERKVGLGTLIKKSVKTVNKTIKQKADIKKANIISNTNCSKKAEVFDNTRKSHVTVKNSIQKKFTKHSLVNRSDINPKKAEIDSQKPEDPIEISLESMFHNIKPNTSIQMHGVKLNRSGRHIEENVRLQKSGDPIEASLETMFCDINQVVDISMNTELTNISSQHRKYDLGTLQTPERAIEVSAETMNNSIDQNKNSNTDKHVQRKEREKENNLQQKSNFKMNNEQRSRSIKNLKQKVEHLPISKYTNKKSLKIPINVTNEKVNIKMDSGASTENDNNIKEKTGHASKVKLDTAKNIVEKKADDQIKVMLLSKCEKKIEEKAQHLRKSKESLDARINKIEKASIKLAIKPSQSSDKNIKEKSEKPLQNTENITNRNLETVSKIDEQKVSDQMNSRQPSRANKNTNDNEYSHNSKIKIKKSHEASVNNAKKSVIKFDTKNLNVSDNCLKEKTEHLQKSKDTILKSVEPTNDKPESMAEIKTDKQSPNTSDKLFIEKAEDLLKCAIAVAKLHATPIDKNKEKDNIKIDMERSNESYSNINDKAEKILQKSEEIIKRNLEATVNSAENNTNIKMAIKLSNTSDVKNKQKSVNSLQKSEAISQKSLKTENDMHGKAKCTTNVEITTNSDKNAQQDTFSKQSVPITKKVLPAVNTKINSTTETATKTVAKPNNTEENHVKSPETNNNIQKSSSIDDGKSIKDLNTNVAETVCETNKHNGIKMEHKTKINQKKVDSNDRKNSDLYIQNNESKEEEVRLSPISFEKILEARMFKYLDTKYTVTSQIHVGNFSVIYKCKDIKGECHAIKVLNKSLRRQGIWMEQLLAPLQKYKPRCDSLLYLLNGFGVEGHWCLLTEYYPKNLEQALEENKRCFHIDLVQVLSRQLVDAVQMLTDNGIIHTDIKPTHLLLNSKNDRLKLCGFDRAINNCERMNIIPSTGSPCYRAPEIILGFLEGHKIDVWSTALVMYEMATNKQLLPGQFNNDILYKQLCTLSSFSSYWEMARDCKLRDLYFMGSSFIRHVGKNGQKSILLHEIPTNKKLEKQLFLSYNEDWAHCRTSWQVTIDLDKLETLHSLLEKMLALNPINRLPIQFVGASEFINETIA